MSAPSDVPAEGLNPNPTPAPDAPAVEDKQQSTAAAPTEEAQPAAVPAPAGEPEKVAEEKPVSAAPASDAAPQPATKGGSDDDDVNPIDFSGEVMSNNDLPSAETLRKIENYVVLDNHGKSHTFKSLYAGRHVARRVLIIFVRHFYCGVSLPSLLSSPCRSLR